MLASLIEQVLQSKNMGIGKITDMDVITDAGTVRSRIVITKNLKLLNLPNDCIKH